MVFKPQKPNKDMAKGEKKSKAKYIILAVLLAVVAVGLYLYTAIAPATAKPALPKPAFTGTVEEQHVNWIANEIGAYKLHSSLSGEPAEIELVSEGKTYTITTKDGKPVTSIGAAKSPDLRLTMPQATLIKLLSAADVNAEIVKLYNAGEVKIDLLKDEATLALKGYKGIYDAVQAGK